MSFLEERINAAGTGAAFNAKLCWEARDTLFSCVDKQPN